MKKLLILPFIVCAVLLIGNTARFTVTSRPLQPVVVTEPTAYDTDDPAIWVNSEDPMQSLVIGTDKHSDGGLYVFDLDGRIIREKTVYHLKRPNNVDIAYGLVINNTPIDIAVVTERETSSLRIFALPSMRPLDGGGIPVFENETQAAPMGIALYTRPADHAVFAIVSRKEGPRENYLWQYRLTDDGAGKVKAQLVRKFGKYSGKKEIESVAVDDASGYVYYSDETYGVHKYYADPAKGNQELALFGTHDFKEDIEGISIYKTGSTTGYLLISNQQANQFMVYPREGAPGNVHNHTLIKAIDFETVSSDGSEVVNANLGSRFPKGMFVAMSEKKVFKYFDWRDIEKKIQAP